MKTIYLETNHNNKLQCNCFLHIAKAPDVPVPESEFPKQVLIKTKDASYPEFTAMLTNIYRVPLLDLADLECWQSHGLTAFLFTGQFSPAEKENNPEMCVYFYKKCE